MIFLEIGNRLRKFWMEIALFSEKVVTLQLKKLTDMNEYRFINIYQEPSEEQLAQLMCEVAADAKERYEKAHAAYFAHIDQMIQAL